MKSKISNLGLKSSVAKNLAKKDVYLFSRIFDRFLNSFLNFHKGLLSIFLH